MKTGGRPKFDSVFLGEVRIDLLVDPTSISLMAVAGFLDSKTGRRLGSLTARDGWSPATLKCLGELLDSMEQDLVDNIFEGGPTGGGAGPVATPTDGIPGL